MQAINLQAALSRQRARERTSAWKKANRATVNTAQRRRRANDPERLVARELAERLAAEQPAKNRARVKAWQKANPEKVKAQKALRRARLRGCSTSGPITRDEIAERDAWLCHLCAGDVTREDWSLDHLVPLSRGGAHARENVKLAHHLCNARRGARPLAVENA